MKAIPHSPSEGVYASTRDYVHAMEIRDASRTLYIAGTMGLDPTGSPGSDIHEQIEFVWNNIRAILASADMTVDNIVRLTSYLRDPSFADANAAARVAALNGRLIPTTVIVVQALSDDWLVEIEVIAAG